MAAALALGVLDAFVLGSTGTITGLAILISSYQELKSYLDSGKLIDLIPASDTSSRQLVTATGLGDLTAMDGALIGTSTAGLLLLLNPKLRVAGGVTLLASFITGRNRDNAKIIAVTSSAVAATIANPVGAVQAALQLGGVAANATLNGLSSAMQLSTTALGLLVTLSGAVVGYVLVKE